MDDPTSRPSPVTLLTSYRDYFARADMDTFQGRYNVVLTPYKIDPENTTATVGLQEFAWKIYAAAQEDVPTAFIQWHRGSEGSWHKDRAPPLRLQLRPVGGNTHVYLVQPLLRLQGRGDLRSRHMRKLDHLEPASDWRRPLRPDGGGNQQGLGCQPRGGAVGTILSQRLSCGLRLILEDYLPCGPLRGNVTRAGPHAC